MADRGALRRHRGDQPRAGTHRSRVRWRGRLARRRDHRPPGAVGTGRAGDPHPGSDHRRRASDRDHRVGEPQATTAAVAGGAPFSWRRRRAAEPRTRDAARLDRLRLPAARSRACRGAPPRPRPRARGLRHRTAASPCRRLARVHADRTHRSRGARGHRIPGPARRPRSRSRVAASSRGDGHPPRARARPAPLPRRAAAPSR